MTAAESPTEKKKKKSKIVSDDSNISSAVLSNEKGASEKAGAKKSKKGNNPSTSDMDSLKTNPISNEEKHHSSGLNPSNTIDMQLRGKEVNAGEIIDRSSSNQTDNKIQPFSGSQEDIKPTEKSKKQ